ncbi:hypothetical protein NC651_022942 [Populus alba x Populus x berolinensis]|nr:hypothetical protein NC651_022942 [Populus alba x Populus x berolinensis]
MERKEKGIAIKLKISLSIPPFLFLLSNLIFLGLSFLEKFDLLYSKKNG